MNQSIDDIVFENRNREYGSYQLRKRYFRRLFLSFMISLTGILIFVLCYYWYLNADRNETVYLFPSTYPSLKNTQGSLLKPEDLASLMQNPETRKAPETEPQEEKPKDVLHNFKVTDEAATDTFTETEEKEADFSDNTDFGIATDSTVFGGYLFGAGDGSGMGSNLDKFPEFPGGPDAARRYIELTVIYPLQAIKQKINGVVIVSFDVNKQGNVENIKIERGVNPILDKEAIKAVSNMPAWKPGVRHGRPVIVKFIIPVRFMPIS